MQTAIHGYELLAAELRLLSSAPVFGLLGHANMMPFVALADADDQRLVNARHESAAVAMAMGYARVTGEVGVCTVTCGPGLTQTATPLMGAAKGRIPIVLIAGDVAERDPNRLQVMSQEAYAVACQCAFVRVTKADQIPSATREAFARARLERRPIILSIPQDAMHGVGSPNAGDRPAVALADPRVSSGPDIRQVELLARKLMSAERAVLVGGLGCREPGVAERVKELADHVGALLATSLPAKNLFLDDPWDIGISGGFASGVGASLMGEADLVLGVGASLNYYTLGAGQLYSDAEIFRIDREIDVDAALEGHTVLIGDAGVSVDALLRAVRELGASRTGFRTEGTAALLATPRPEQWPDAPADGIDPRVLVDVVAPHVPRDARIVVGGGHFWAFPVMYMAGTADNDWLLSYQFGSIGLTLPQAIGAWFAEPSRALVVFEGDCSLLMTINELDTIARYRIPVVVIVGNDAGFGSEVHKLRAAGHRDDIVSFPTPDFAALATAFGGRGHVVERIEELKSVAAEIANPGGLVVIDARVSPSLPSDPYRRLYYAQKGRSPRLMSAAVVPVASGSVSGSGA